jgi:hypothetical protein
MTTKKEDTSKWIYLDDETARSSKLYGVNGWAIILLISIIAPIVLIAYTGVNQFINPSDYKDSIITIFDHIKPGYKNYHFITDIQSIVFQILHIVAAYLLLKHSSKFQIFYAVLVITGLLSDIAMFSWSLEMEEISQETVPTIIGIFISLYGVYLLTLVYVFKSKRINLTTKKRIEKKYQHLIESDRTQE